MFPALILFVTFSVGFVLGYAARDWRSRKRRAHYLLYAPYGIRGSSEKASVAEASPRAKAHDRAGALIQD
ncbi:hypothetical protein [Bradyrhizobium sp. Ai1a-2]|uniref:hypothetical protein n=1 Tax=Bradyrhizobium sp. Ai1a-2 TaxID=196490 RepID=UPI00048659DA|nr:hypothetical protein [Bradyrhizobium sp. Ai1a-2]